MTVHGVRRRLGALDDRLIALAEHSPIAEFLAFGFKQARACVFGAAMLALLIGSHFLWPSGAPLARYDFLFLAALAIQAVLIASRAEHGDEVAVIVVFHLVGTAMELFKTAQGSWTYPEEAFFRIGGVPLFSGFMYASVGSYMARAWRLQALEFTRYPPTWATWAAAVAAYVNFFTHHFAPDIRWLLFAFTIAMFARTVVTFYPASRPRRMPLLLAFILVALFIWFAENAATYANAWLYPSQAESWRPVALAKLGSWYLLMMLSFVLVAAVRRR